MSLAGWKPDFKNAVPVQGEIEVLTLLAEEYQDCTRRKLFARHGEEPRVEIKYYYQRSGEFAKSEQYRISSDVFHKLWQRGCIRGVPYMGYTSTEEFMISEYGKGLLRESENEKHKEEKFERNSVQTIQT